MIEAPYYPIVYVRGYAGTQGEVEDTTATPYMGFNLGATKLRQAHTGRIVSHVFESPLIRLMKDEGYADAYRDGQILPSGPVPSRSVWIFRYYDVTSRDLGSGERKEIEYHAERLREFLLHVRDAVLEPGEEPARFRAYLVAHSMGGLVCRCYLQNRSIPGLDGRPARTWTDKGVDKLFTYATPHGGIEFRRGLGWAEGLRDFLDPNNAGNFGPRRMREFLDLDEDEPLGSLAGRFPAERVFCMVGTDARDYGAAAGLARRAVGPLSDGLVQIENATVRGAPRAFVHRSHSGHYGIVNSESGYQNLTRFLFGNVRVDGRLEVRELRLPPKVERAWKAGRTVRASYHFDVVVGVRGARWTLHRRTVDEGSAIFRTFDQMMDPDKAGRGSARHPYLFSAFLDRRKIVGARRRSLGFSVDLAVHVPEYELDRRWWADGHYEGGFLFRDKLNLEVTPPPPGKPWRLRYGFDSRTPNRATRTAVGGLDGDAVVFRIPVENGSRPGLAAELVLTCTPWA
ncbi:MAG: hypothetical protein Kow0092_35840 [Deferrisomatales bacterium]